MKAEAGKRERESPKNKKQEKLQPATYIVQGADRKRVVACQSGSRDRMAQSARRNKIARAAY